LALNGTYTHYKTTEQQYAWHKPAYDLEFTGRYNIQEKIVLTAKAIITGPVWALVPVHVNYFISGPEFIMQAKKLKGWTDINLGAEYRFNKALSFWININNLTNSKYYRWSNYRSYGINLLGGVSYSF
jgi:outer membrane receptor protein involved in Fe transport